MSERLFALMHHFCYGCPETRCHFVYTKEEIQSDEMETYLVNHKYLDGYLLDVHQLELKTWTLDEIININTIYGWTPTYIIKDNGFKFEKIIDLFTLFGTPAKPYQDLHKHDLNKKQSELEKIFEDIKYSERELIVFRTQRGGLCNWDSLVVFSAGLYHDKKKIMRSQITGDCLLRQKHDDERRKQALAEKDPNEKPLDWEKVKKRLNELAKNTKSSSGFLFNPRTDKAYNMSSKKDRKKLYHDVTNRKNPRG